MCRERQKARCKSASSMEFLMTKRKKAVSSINLASIELFILLSNLSSALMSQISFRGLGSRRKPSRSLYPKIKMDLRYRIVSLSHLSTIILQIILALWLKWEEISRWRKTQATEEVELFVWAAKSETMIMNFMRLYGVNQNFLLFLK